jgi:hypothetical protein
LLAGCTGSLVGTTTETDVQTDEHGVTNGSGKERAIDAETDRIERLVANESRIGDLAFGAVTADPYQATVTDRTATGVKLDIVVSVGYRLNCTDSSAGEHTVSYVDGVTVRSAYLVTSNGTQLLDVSDPLITC